MNNQKNIKVLIAEDDYLVSDDIRRILKKGGYEVIGTASDGNQAIELTCSLKPDVVLMDIKMPETDGLEATQKIQQSCPTPIVILSAHESVELVNQAGEMGASAYLVKPPQAAEMERAIIVALARHADLMKLRRSNDELQLEIAKRKRVENSLRESERRYRLLAENSRDMIYLQSLPDGRYEYVSPASIELIGYSPEEICNEPMHIRKTIHPDWADWMEEQWEKVISGDMASAYEYQIINKSGETRWLHQRNVLISDDSGRPIAIEGTVTDITERKRVENTLRKSEASYQSIYGMFRLMADNMPDMLWAKDMDRRFLFANQAICDKLLLARNTSEPIGKDTMFFINKARLAHPDNPDWHTFGKGCVNSDEVVMNNRKLQKFEEFGNVQGEFLYMDVYKAPILDLNGKMIGTVGCGRDVTREKQIEHELHASETNFRTFFNTIDNFLFIIDERGCISEVNQTVIDRLGYTIDELKNQPLLSLHPENRQDEVKQLITEVLQKKRKSCLIPLLTKKGELIAVETHAHIGVWNGKPAVLSVSKDISALKQSEEKFAIAFHSSPALMGMSNLETGEYVEVNQTFYDKLGFTPEQVIGKNAVDVLKLDLKFKEISVKRLQEQGFIQNQETVITRHDGTPITILVSARLIELNNRIYNFTTAIDITERKLAQEKLKEAEFRYRTAADFTYDWESWEIPDGTFRYISPACKRITGYTVKQFMDDPALFNTIIFPEDREIWDKHHYSMFENPRHQEIRFRIRRQDGKTAWIEHVCRPVIDEQGTFMGLRSSNRDITKRKQTEAVLRESMEKYFSLFNEMLDGFALHDIILDDEGNPVDYRFLDVNPAFEKLTGLKRDTLLNKTVLEVLPDTES